VIVLVGALVLSMQGAPPQENAPPSQPAPAAEQPGSTAPRSGPEDVDLLPQAAAPDLQAVARQQQIEGQLQTRRKMLQLHQLGGMLTLASLGGTVVLGQLNYIDKYGGGGDTGQWANWHKYFAYTSAAIFAATGALAIFAPSPLEKPMRLDTVMIHRISMGVATAGMVTQIILGVVTASKGGSVSQRDYALAHQIVGYTTFAATAVGFGVLTF
jgi:hypothetical protein